MSCNCSKGGKGERKKKMNGSGKWGERPRGVFLLLFLISSVCLASSWICRVCVYSLPDAVTLLAHFCKCVWVCVCTLACTLFVDMSECACDVIVARVHACVCVCVHAPIFCQSHRITTKTWTIIFFHFLSDHRGVSDISWGRTLQATETHRREWTSLPANEICSRKTNKSTYWRLAGQCVLCPTWQLQMVVTSTYPPSSYTLILHNACFCICAAEYYYRVIATQW